MSSKLYIIETLYEPKSYWIRGSAFVAAQWHNDRELATEFTEQEHGQYRLPDGGCWVLLNEQRAHVLLTPATCNFKHDDRQCPVCDGGLAVCANCSQFEAGLDGPCTVSAKLDAGRMSADGDPEGYGSPNERCVCLTDKDTGQPLRGFHARPCPLDDLAERNLTGIHDSDTCTLGANGGPCDQCLWAANTERAPFPEQATYDLGEQQRGIEINRN